MRLKVFKKKIETVLFKRVSDNKKYIVFSSGIKHNLINFNSYNVLNYSLKHSFQKILNTSLVNNFLKASSFSNVQDFSVFIKNLKTNANLIYFIKFKNLYIFNRDSNFEKKFNTINIDAYSFVLRLQKLLFNWLPLLKLVVKTSSK